MTNEVKNVPELRFPGFEDEWKINLFGELVTNKSDKYLPKNNEQLIDIELDSIESNTGRLIHKYNSSHFSSQKHKFNKNQVLYSKLRPYLNKYYFTNFNGVCSSEIWVLNTKSDLKLINEFIYNFIQTNKFSQIANKSAGSKMPRADWNLVENIRFNIPILKEQEKIGSFFSKLDRQIELEEQKLEKLEEQKKGYMQQIFSQNIRFKDENGNNYPEWETNKIEDIATVTKGFTPSTKNNDYWYDENKNWLSIAGMNKKYLYHGNKGITELASQKHDKVDENTLIMSFKLTLGKLGIVKEPMYTNEAICHFNWKNKNVNTEYVYYYLNYINIDSFGSQAVKGITLNNDSINSIVIKLPSLSEQYKISDLFKKYDNFIEKQSNKIELLKERKKGFLQKMFV